jgi:hypothetical protein
MARRDCGFASKLYRHVWFRKKGSALRTGPLPRQNNVRCASEYCWRFSEGFGMVSFGGFGGVAQEICQFDTVLPSFRTVLLSAICKVDVTWCC